MSEIKVGDRIYLERFGKIQRVETVVKLTKTLIRSENYNYRYPSDGSGWLHITGQDGWHSLGARLETPELKQEWHEQRLRKWMEGNYKNISIDDIEALKKKMEANQ